MNLFEKILTTVGIFIGVSLLSLLVFRIGWVNYIDSTEFAYQFDSRNGQISEVYKKGYYVSSPFVTVHTVEMRPMQICLNANNRVLNCKLVEFDTLGWRELIRLHGRKNYSNDGGSFGGGSGNSSGGGGLNDIFASYAYDGSGKLPSFIHILKGSAIEPKETILIKDTIK